ncbi:hypothetical protein CBR_g32638 [Chara braunii]|uniref:Uncharacterized protein n=1 Tax=Chara braunii TaxID=69332 RepID=A0A388LHC0_CHABU|nr:hypothetical protein CBR_g32638 [Chara braunii]|eukprot:GBG81645.1 hypothetical protein CBR_g32638 [Chara braunii]
MQEATMRDDEGKEVVAGVDESVAGVDDGAAQVEMEEDVVRADAAVLVGGEEGVVGGDVAHGTGEGGAHLDPIVQRFVDDEMGPALAGLTPGTRRALGASPSGQRGASGLGMGDFMDISLGDSPTPAHAVREDVARALAAAGYCTQEIEQAFAGRSGRETDSLQQGCEEVVEQPQEEREDAPPADIHEGSSSLVPFTGLQMTNTMRLAAAARAVREQTSRRSGVARTSSMPQMMPATGDAALEECSGAEGLEMPRGSRGEKTVAEVTQVSARLVRVRTGAAHVTVVEDDPETEPAREEAPQEGDEYRDDEEREEEESDNGDDDSYHDDDDEPSPHRDMVLVDSVALVEDMMT